jgi:hypothetical protein
MNFLYNPFPESDSIDIEFNAPVLQIPALVSGPKNQRGITAVTVQETFSMPHLLLLKPGKRGTMKTTNPPFR